uniref:RING-type domain-containing protein n=1 Tax=Neobodo designis TaxID=312471 RepID=A0A7S1LSL3_NEODS|mmetsp:Transcript_27539/g.85371  ORF Transcript_27539/g.85371 Transcript_27539/m.85371 type:complete len:261 (+) Transcript_27539:70-852(+)
MGCSSSKTKNREGESAPAAAEKEWAPPEVDRALQPEVIVTGVGNCFRCGRGFNSDEGGRRAFELPCGHQFHEACVEAQLRDARACPVCGAEAHPATVPSMRVSRSALSVEVSARRSRSPSNASRLSIAPSDRSPETASPSAPVAAADDFPNVSLPGVPEEAGTNVPAPAPPPALPQTEEEAEPSPLPQLPADDKPLIFQPTSVLEEPCAVCEGRVAHDAALLSCGHVFHAGCVDQHLAVHHACPICGRAHSEIVKPRDFG